MLKLVGLSVSFCVQDIAEGRVPRDAVEFVIPGFDFTKTSRDELFVTYSHVYWDDYPEKARDVFEKIDLRPHGVPGGQNIAFGHWMRLEDYRPDMDLRRGEADQYKIDSKELQHVLESGELPQPRPGLMAYSH
jgi:hypothetical protein